MGDLSDVVEDERLGIREEKAQIAKFQVARGEVQKRRGWKF